MHAASVSSLYIIFGSQSAFCSSQSPWPYNSMLSFTSTGSSKSRPTLAVHNAKVDTSSALVRVDNSGSSINHNISSFGLRFCTARSASGIQLLMNWLKNWSRNAEDKEISFTKGDEDLVYSIRRGRLLSSR